ncbi:hypothetical protein [Nocardioides sp.]|uniref:hypothetical protein n=1 Tax=Nocardioides sp. TaxID=35761 RepID=UPI0026219E76|nr:hypothetical protein [Nocardioides sp.]
MSPIVVLGAFGTLFSTITILPHVVRAIRTKKPGGSPLAWAMGATGAVVWLAYGIASGDPLVGAPGVVTIPAGVLLTIWSSREGATRAAPITIAALPVGAPLPVPAAAASTPPVAPAMSEALPPTLEMPAVA